MSSIVSTYDLFTKGPQVVFKDVLVNSELNNLSSYDELKKTINKIQSVIDKLQIIRILSAIATGYYISLAMNFVFTPLLVSTTILMACNLLIMNLSNKLDILKWYPIPDSRTATIIKASLLGAISTVGLGMIYYCIRSTYAIFTLTFSK